MPFITIFNFLLLNVLQFLYWIFFDILPQETLDYMQGSTKLFERAGQ